ncbi:protein CURVATURE THYLAKOID 1D [Pyrus ussuriensis x Pyrus communis]|uniref:Protein CURVATURE THYLAKOID 1D n=1 Tax=Pyrus ussuriensis x Pyrus communis TaxID=2448454 RepID=A0A5N5F3D5_9ROSA|nr:protein CURVATURE THYLAKOID 1D [Pyrus ussuriensis x Pyrus communis]
MLNGTLTILLILSGYLSNTIFDLVQYSNLFSVLSLLPLVELDRDDTYSLLLYSGGALLALWKIEMSWLLNFKFLNSRFLIRTMTDIKDCDVVQIVPA